MQPGEPEGCDTEEEPTGELKMKWGVWPCGVGNEGTWVHSEVGVGNVVHVAAEMCHVVCGPMGPWLLPVQPMGYVATGHLEVGQPCPHA